MDITNLKRAFTQLLFEANLLLKKEGVLENKKRFFEFAPLLILKLMSENTEMSYSRQSMRLKPKYHWKRFAKQEPERMLQTLNYVILPGLVKTHNRHTQFFQQKSSIKNPGTLKKLVDRLSLLNLLALDSDILGDAFEYFLHQDGARYKRGLGIYFTPRHVVKLLLDLMPLKPNDKIYDPTCGAGGFLTEAFKRLKKHSRTSSRHLSKKIIFGREISDSIKIAKMNLIMLGAHPSTLCQIDTLKKPVRDKFSVILANFPFSQKTDCGSLYGFKGKDANPLFLKHIMDALMLGGTASVIVPDRLLFSESLEYIKARKELIGTCNLLAVIQLHDFVFRPYTKQPTSILIFKKGAPTKTVWFFDVREDGFQKTTRLSGRPPIISNDFHLLRTLWKNKKDSCCSFSVSVSDIMKENYHLSMNRYKNLNQFLKSQVKLGELCDIVVGETPLASNPHFYGGENLFVRVKDMDQSIIKNTQDTLTDEGVHQSNLKLIKKHTLLFSFKLTIAKVAFAGKKLYTSEAVAGLIPKDHRVLSQYLYYILPQLDYCSYVNRGCKGQELTRNVLATIRIPLPSLSIQKKFIRIFNRQNAKKESYLIKLQKITVFKNKKIQELIEKYQCKTGIKV